MPDTKQTAQPVQEAAPRNNRLMITGVIVVLIAFAVVGGVKYYFYKATVATNQQVRAQYDAVTEGDYAGQIAVTEEILASPLATEDQKALSQMNTASLPFRTTNDPQYLLSHIPVLKSITLNTEVSMWIRVVALNTLASSFCGSGRTWAVFEEIYKGEPFSKFYVPGDPDQSSRNMFTWSYDLYPTVDSSIYLARSYMSDANSHAQERYNAVGTSTFDRDIQQSQIYLTASEKLLPGTMERDPSYKDSSRYAAYLYWRAYTLGLLAHYYPDQYKGQYKTAYDEFLNKFATSEDKNTIYMLVPYSYLLYAHFLVMNDNDTAAALPLLEKLEATVKSDPYYSTSPFVRFVHNERELRTTKNIRQGPFSDGMEDAVKISANFKKFVDSIK